MKAKKTWYESERVLSSGGDERSLSKTEEDTFRKTRDEDSRPSALVALGDDSDTSSLSSASRKNKRSQDDVKKRRRSRFRHCPLCHITPYGWNRC